MSWFVSKWRVKAEAAELENGFLREALTASLKDVEYFRERYEKATDALLALEQKPAITKPDREAAMQFMDKNLNFFNDIEGGQDVA